MNAEQLLKEGCLPEALDALQQQIRKAPGDAPLRVFLFQLLAVMGSWERAGSQLKVAAELDDKAIVLAQMYQTAIQCEVFRAEVLQGVRTPLFIGKPPDWSALLLEALRLLGSGKPAPAAQLRDAAFEQAPATAGSLDGQAFSWIADGDTHLGPVLEAIVNGGYYWLPFSQILRIEFEVPEDLRDLVWLPARLTLSNQGQVFALVPARYPGSAQSDEPAFALARKTSWLDRGDGWFNGLGQRMLITDRDEYPLLECRQIVLRPAPSRDRSAAEETA